MARLTAFFRAHFCFILLAFNILPWMIQASSCLLLGIQEDTPRPLIQVQIADPSSRLIYIQAQLRNLKKGEQSLFFKGPGIDTEPKNVRLYDKEKNPVEYLQSPDGKITFKGDPPEPIALYFELRPGDIYFNEKRLLLLGGQSLFLYDLEEWNPVDVTFEFPKSWDILTTSIRKRPGSYRLNDVRDGQFLLGNFKEHFDIHESHLKFSDITLAVEKGSPFESQELSKFVIGFIQTMHSILHGYPEKKMAVFFLQFPKEFKKIGYRGSATRDTVYYLCGGLEGESEEFKRQVLWKFGHELFHAFNPQSLKPKEPQDMYWFWEGVTDYMALKISSYNRLYDKEAFLKACADVYRRYVTNPLRDNLSLIQASREFFSNRYAEDLTYDKGFLVAFLMDLELFFHGDELGSLDDFLRLLFRKYVEEKEACSGQKIMNEMEAVSPLKQISDPYIKKPESETGGISFASYGLEVTDSPCKFVISKESPRQTREVIFRFLSFAERLP